MRMMRRERPLSTDRVTGISRITSKLTSSPPSASSFLSSASKLAFLYFSSFFPFAPDCSDKALDQASSKPASSRPTSSVITLSPVHSLIAGLDRLHDPNRVGAVAHPVFTSDYRYVFHSQ